MNVRINKKTSFIDLGLIDYKVAWDYQTELFQKTLAVKSYNREHESDQRETANYLIFCEHPHVFTLGKSGKEANLLVTKDELEQFGASYYHINRGGDITYHGPGQIVAYPVIDLENFFTDIHRYMRLLEEAVILTCRDLGLDAGRIEGLTGVWIDFEDADRARKICALGVKTSRWVTMHGLAFNVNTDLRYFEHIVPCGIDDKAVTSVELELKQPQDMQAIAALLRGHLSTLFSMEML